ncbi:MAG: type IV pilus modification protein PilV [Steroidobacteraceae bacterium]
MKSFYAQRGITMVEAMVALLVLSFGMLGVAGLYVETLQANRTAVYRTQAVYLINDMADRIRANRRGRGAYAVAAGTPVVAGVNCVVAANCSEVQLADSDIAIWQARVAELLPRDAGGANATTQIQFAAGANLNSADTYRLSVSWTEPGEPNPLTANMTMQLIPGSAL